MQAIKNVNIVLTDKIIKNGMIIFGDNIEEVLDSEYSDITLTEVIDGKGGYLTPGLIDIHIHGAGGRDTMEGKEEALNTISKTIIKYGVTSFLPTTMTMPKDDIYKSLDIIKKCKNYGLDGAKILGANVEGPFINPEYKGAQKKENIERFKETFFDKYLDIIKIITVAPEISEAKKLIRHMKEKGIIVSVGHSGASFTDIRKAQKWGISHTTHLFNAMTGLHHRKPGIVGAVLASDMSCELIADYIHIHPEVLNLVTKVKNNDNIMLITDSMEAGGLGEGIYSLGGQQVTVKNGSARLENGALAGSILTLDMALRNMLKATKLGLSQVVKMVTFNQACLLQMQDKIGKIAPGLRADLTLFDNNFEVQKVFICGKECYSK